MHILYLPHKKMAHGQVYLTLDPDVEGEVYSKYLCHS